MYTCMCISCVPWVCVCVCVKCMHMHLHCICVLTSTLVESTNCRCICRHDIYTMYVCEMDAHAFALQLCIAHFCVHLPGNDNDCYNSNTSNTTATCEGVQAPLQRTQQGQSLVMKTCTRACDGARVQLDHQEKHALQWHLKKTNMSRPGCY